MGTVLLAGIVGVAIWFWSPYLRDRLTTSVAELQAYRVKDAANSTGLHLEFLRKSLTFVQTAPIVGHGTGSIPEQFRNAAVGHDGASSAPSENPHNQIFAVAIQLGLVGAAVLLAMWIAHFLLFLRGAGLTAWIGMIVVVQNDEYAILKSFADFERTPGVPGFTSSASASPAAWRCVSAIPPQPAPQDRRGYRKPAASRRR